MTGPEFLIDVAIVALLLGLGTRLLLTRELFEAIVLFISYGLTLSLAWVRLGSPDIAIAEAALGAGVTGALFLNTYQRLAARVDEESRIPILEDGGHQDPSPLVRGSIGIALLACGAGATWVLLQGADREALLPRLVVESLEASGVENPATAVLLNFRGHDTLFEIAILLAAMVGVWSLDRGKRRFGRPFSEPAFDPILGALLRVVVPAAIVTAVYLTWVGSTRPGGAFQAGALLAGVGVLLTVSGVLPPQSAASTPVRAVAAGGLGGFVLAGISTLPLTGQFLHYPEGWAYPMILGIESVLTIAIAVVLLELFTDVPAVPDPDPSLAEIDPSGDPLGRALDQGAGR